jgi:hypothetical protein
MNKSYPLIVALVVCLFAHTADACVKKYIPNAQKIGHGRMQVMFWNVYDATLHAPYGKLSQKKPFALELHYNMALDGEKIAERSTTEMKQQGASDREKLSAWDARMKKIFPDVKAGDTITGVFLGGKTVFCLANKEIGTITDAEFTRRFSDIWLSEKTTAPELRAKLLGGTK